MDYPWSAAASGSGPPATTAAARAGSAPSSSGAHTHAYRTEGRTSREARPSSPSSSSYAPASEARRRSLSPGLERALKSAPPLPPQLLHGRRDQGWGERKARIEREAKQRDLLIGSPAVAPASASASSAWADEWDVNPRERERARERREGRGGEKRRDRDYRRDRPRSRSGSERPGPASSSSSSRWDAERWAGSPAARSSASAAAPAASAARVHLPDPARAAAPGGFQIPYRARAGKRAREDDEDEAAPVVLPPGPGSAGGMYGRAGELGAAVGGKGKQWGRRVVSESSKGMRAYPLGALSSSRSYGHGRYAAPTAAKYDYDAAPPVPPLPPPDPYARHVAKSFATPLLARLDRPPAAAAPTLPATLVNGVPVPASLPQRPHALPAKPAASVKREEAGEGELEEGELEEGEEEGEEEERAQEDYGEGEYGPARPPRDDHATCADDGMGETPPLPDAVPRPRSRTPVEEGADEEGGTPPPPAPPAPPVQRRSPTPRRAVSLTPPPPPKARTPTPPLRTAVLVGEQAEDVPMRADGGEGSLTTVLMRPEPGTSAQDARSPSTPPLPPPPPLPPQGPVPDRIEDAGREEGELAPSSPVKLALSPPREGASEPPPVRSPTQLVEPVAALPPAPQVMGLSPLAPPAAALLPPLPAAAAPSPRAPTPPRPSPPKPSPAVRQRPLPPPPPPPYVPPADPSPPRAVTARPPAEATASVPARAPSPPAGRPVSAAVSAHVSQPAAPPLPVTADSSLPVSAVELRPAPVVAPRQACPAASPPLQAADPQQQAVGLGVGMHAVKAALSSEERSEMRDAPAPAATGREDVEMPERERGLTPPAQPHPPSPHPTDELHRHSPTTPQEQEQVQDRARAQEHEQEQVQAERRLLTPPGPHAEEIDAVLHDVMREDAVDDAAAAQSGESGSALDERLGVADGVVVREASAAERDELFAATWDAVDEPHQRISAALLETFAARDDRRRDKAIALRREYKALNDDWKAHCRRLDRLRDRVHRRDQAGGDGATVPQTPSIDSAGMPFYPEPVTPGPSSGLFGGGVSSRANRRSAAGGAAFGTGYGDAVRSEAEFLEILASLETADLRDPDARAARTAAVVPDMVIDPAERRELFALAFDDARYRVEDPVATFGIDQPLDVWTEDEVETFCKRFAAHPKQFGKIAADLPDKSTAQCVLFYYRMKNTIDFRSLSDRRGRDGRRKKSKKRPEGGKGSSLLSNLNKKPRTAAPPPIDERDDEDDGESAPASPRARARAPSGAPGRTLGPAPAPETAPPSAQGEVSDDPTTRPTTAPTPKRAAAQQLLPSEGMLEAAEALGALGALAAGGEEDDHATPRARARKPRAGTDSTDALADAAFVDPAAAVGASDKVKPKRTTSSYWTVAERNEIVRLLGEHGTDWKKIANGLENKTWVQCRNWYQANAKKQGLSDIVNESDGNEPDASPAVEHFGNGVLLQENMGPATNRPSLPRAGFFDTPDRQQLPPLPMPEPTSRPNSTGTAGMHIRNMLNDEPEEEATTPARDDWFGTEVGDAASATTEDDPQARAPASAAAVDARALDGLRTSSAPQPSDPARLPNGAHAHFRPTPPLPSFPSSLGQHRYEGQASLSAYAGQQWSRSSTSPFPAFAASPAASASASPLTPAPPAGDYYRRTTFDVARPAPGGPDYFAAKPYERYARRADPPAQVAPYAPAQQSPTFPPPAPVAQHPPASQWLHDPARR
ncbi:hypothetical protein JCM3770_000372 [Rhodotorula araucariae]